MVDVSVIIVCMNRPDNLFPCLDSIRSTTTVSYETFVVAYLYDPDRLAEARERYPWVKFIVSDEIRGFAENNNLALRQAGGRFCFVFNDDAEVRGDTVDRLVADFGRLPEDAAIVSPKLLNADGTLQLCGRPPHTAAGYVRHHWHLYEEPADNVAGLTPLFDQVYRTHNITGAAFMIRTDVFRELGWFDERFFFTPEDIALGALACGRGYGIYVDAEAEVVHKWRTTASKMMCATRPAAVRGSLMHFSSFKAGKYLLLAVPVWLAEFAKRTKAFLVAVVSPGEVHSAELKMYRNITRSIFTTRTPKQIFRKYYERLHKV